MASSAVGAVITVSGTGAKGNQSASHKFVVVAEDTANKDWLIVPICTHHSAADETCIITPSDDATLVRHRSYVGYYQATIIPKRSHPVGGSVSASLLAGICSGINASEEVEPWFRDKYNRLTNPAKRAGRVLRTEE